MSGRASVHRCASCGARIFWAFTEAGRRMPVNVETSPAGMFVLFEGQVAGEAHCRRAVEGDLLRRDSHFANCPNASRHRRARAAT